jgi:hypothetical protein
MKRQKTYPLLVLLAATAAIPGFADSTTHETPVPVAAADYVSDETLAGSGLTLDPMASPDGATLQFTGTGPRGRFAISGRENLCAYAAMLRAMAELEKMDREKMFGSAAGKAAKAPVEAAAKLMADPGKTLAAMPKGAMNFLQRTGRQIKENSRQIAEGSANSTGAADLVGLGSIKRQLAVSLGVDPYLPDETFQNILNETASAADLRASDREDLAALGVAPDTIAALFANRWYTPASTAVLVDSLTKLGTKNGVPQFVATCAAAEDTAQATYYREVAALLAQRTAAQGPLDRLEFFHALPVAVSQKNELVVPLPADLLWWTPIVDDISQALLEGEDAPLAGVELWTDGRLTPAADTALRERGYAITQRK